jgi:hypothetical protein
MLLKFGGIKMPKKEKTEKLLEEDDDAELEESDDESDTSLDSDDEF